MNIYILRAGSGAGKSTWTKTNHPKAHVFSADLHEGLYVNGVFDHTKLGEAHGQCLRYFIEFCQETNPSDPDIVAVVDNTNTTLAEFGPYAQTALAYGHNVQILTFVYDPAEAHARNVHGTPLEACINMYARLTEHTKLIPPWWKHDYVLSK